MSVVFAVPAGYGQAAVSLYDAIAYFKPRPMGSDSLLILLKEIFLL